MIEEKWYNCGDLKVLFDCSRARTVCGIPVRENEVHVIVRDRCDFPTIRPGKIEEKDLEEMTEIQKVSLERAEHSYDGMRGIVHLNKTTFDLYMCFGSTVVPILCPVCKRRYDLPVAEYEHAWQEFMEERRK